MYYSRCPSLNLKGNWLEEAGFTTGQPVASCDPVDRLPYAGCGGPQATD
ncbi:SymE family type I addiction module toxin [Pantoea sp. RRHST58]